MSSPIVVKYNDYLRKFKYHKDTFDADFIKISKHVNDYKSDVLSVKSLIYLKYVVKNKLFVIISQGKDLNLKTFDNLIDRHINSFSSKFSKLSDDDQKKLVAAVNNYKSRDSIFVLIKKSFLLSIK